ncbi:hypothetical protein AA16373_0040 [Komagataeibacter swingsii DSM 16373]|nr:hypothetical protein AA16373_0040 [Komagataeibacter swingsii DSM 16373]
MNRGRDRLLCGPFGLSLRPKPYASYTGVAVTNGTDPTRDAREATDDEFRRHKPHKVYARYTRARHR